LRARDSGDLSRRPTSRFLRRSPVGAAGSPVGAAGSPVGAAARQATCPNIRPWTVGGSLWPDDALRLCRFALSG
jgi:hypothetical protein